MNRLYKMFVTAVLLMMAGPVFAQNDQYVDLGLPSGTLWERFDEDGYYYPNTAVSNFGSSLPTKEQWEELFTYCTWNVEKTGFKVTGKNGNSIYFEHAPRKSWGMSETCLYYEPKIEHLTSTPSDRYSGHYFLAGCNYDGKKMKTWYSHVEYEEATKYCVRLVKKRPNSSTPTYNVTTPTISGTLVYSQPSDVFCNGIYSNEQNGSGAFHTPDLNFNQNHFRVVFSFMPLSNEGFYNWGSDYQYSGDYQWVAVLGRGGRNFGVCLKSDGSIWITTNNQDNYYPTGLSYSTNSYQTLDIEYNHGVLVINNHRISINMRNASSTDCAFHSMNYSNGNAFWGNIKDFKVYTY